MKIKTNKNEYCLNIFYFFQFVLKVERQFHTTILIQFESHLLLPPLNFYNVFKKFNLIIYFFYFFVKKNLSNFFLLTEFFLVLNTIFNIIQNSFVFFILQRLLFCNMIENLTIINNIFKKIINIFLHYLLLSKWLEKFRKICIKIKYFKKIFKKFKNKIK